jgi:hypothetical protein
MVKAQAKRDWLDRQRRMTDTLRRGGARFGGDYAGNFLLQWRGAENDRSLHHVHLRGERRLMRRIRSMIILAVFRGRGEPGQGDQEKNDRHLVRDYKRAAAPQTRPRGGRATLR